MAVFSDTHGDLKGVASVRKQLGAVDWLLHAGDYYTDAPSVAAKLGVPDDRVRAVVGNCDPGTPGPNEELLQLDGVQVLLTHGHLFGVKRGYQRIFYRAKEMGAQVVVFGHTHVPLRVWEDGVLLFNPGSLAHPRVKGKGSCGLLEVVGGRVSGHLIRR